MTTPLEQLALIGDGETAALVSNRGSIDWLCLPRFDSPACCAALVGTRGHGYWSIAPEAALVRSEQHYQRDTLVLETDMTSAGGTIRVTDFMPMREGQPTLVRVVTGTADITTAVPTRMDAALRFDYGNMPAWITRTAGGAVMHVGPDRVNVVGPGSFDIADNAVTSRFTVEAGSRHVFVLRYEAVHESCDDPVDVAEALARTQRYWREWVGRFTLPLSSAHGDAVRRSLITLKAMVHRPTGGLVAAPTTSLPEQPGGSLNWDYRYCWLRDATFAVDALVDSGFIQEAGAWRDWLLRAVAGEPAKMQIVYRVDGSRRLDEVELPWLEGYRFARPVRIGNASAAQFQLDVYGELMWALHAAHAAGVERSEQGDHLELAIVRHVEQVWAEPDQGLWESRGEARHFTYSKAMAWVALQRFLEGAAARDLDSAERHRLADLRDGMHAVICEEGFNAGMDSFTAYFGGTRVDASLLLLPKMGFLSADDPRMATTIARIERDLVVDGLVRRSPASREVPEGAFLACSLWLAECQLAQGRRADAVATIDRVLAIRSATGLLSEQFDLDGQRLAGNYPQALSHLALIQALLALARFDGQLQ